MSEPQGSNPLPQQDRIGPENWPAALQEVLTTGRVTIVHQPIVDVARATTVGFEALARFTDHREQRPDRWFAEARRHGLHAELEALALRVALSDRDLLPPNTFLTLNVSPDLLMSEPVRAVWRDHPDLGGIVVELTEQTPIDSYAALDGDLTALRAAGALIAVDDAGAGYAGLRHLLALRPSIIKVDRELIRDVDRDEAKLALIEMIGTFAGRIDAWLLAEGLERPGELETLAQLGVPLAQGYHLARPGAGWPPLNPEAVLQLTRRHTTTKSSTVRGVVEFVTTARSVELAGSLVATDGQSVVVLDEHSHPLALYTPDLVHLGLTERGMRVNVDTPLRDALLRAVTRPEMQRYTPLLCTDHAGRFVGVIRIERLIHAAVTGE